MARENMKRPSWPMLLDWFWPTLERPSAAQQERAQQRRDVELQDIASGVARLDADDPRLKELLASANKTLDDENARRAGAEARLLSIAGLTSIAGTIVLGTLIAFAGDKPPIAEPVARRGISLFCLYLAIQLFAALLASVRGLLTRGYEEDKPHEMLPADAASWVDFMRIRIAMVLGRVDAHRQVNNEKLSELNVAHRAVKNFLVGLALVALVASGRAWFHQPSEEAVPAVSPSTVVVEVPNHPAPVLLHPVLSVGPFPAGAAAISGNQVQHCIRAAVSVLGSSVTGFQVVGVPDQPGPKAGSKAQQHSGHELALARASWVARELRSHPSYAALPAIAVVGSVDAVALPQGGGTVHVFAIVQTGSTLVSTAANTCAAK